MALSQMVRACKGIDQTHDARRMSTSSPSASPFRFFNHLPALGEACRIGLLVRHRDRQKKIDGHAERPTDFLMQCNRTFAPSRFEVGEIALGDSDSHSKFSLRQAAPFAKHTNRIFAGQPIDNSLRHHDLAAGRDLVARIVHDAGRADILIGGQPGELLIFVLRKYSEFLAARSLDELNLCHDHLSIIDFSAMTYRDDDDRIALDIEDDALIADAQPGADTPFEPLYIALTSACEGQKLGVESPAHIGGEIEPLTRGSGSKDDLHTPDIADRYTNVKRNIAYCDSGERA